MNTRREMALALLGMPLIASSASAQSEVKTNNEAAATATDFLTGMKPGLREAPPPFSVTAATIISFTLYAEARGEPFDGKMAVASVIKTRANRAKISPAEVCQQNKQFTCWNDRTEVPESYLTGKGIQPADLTARGECFVITWVLLAINNHKWDYLTHFYNPDKATPSWANELRGKRTIGRHVFGYID